MVDSVINVVNRALNVLGRSPITSIEFDSSTEQDYQILRGVFSAAYRDVLDAGHEDLLKEHIVTTVANQVTYSLPSYFDIADIYRVRYRALAPSDEGWQLKYYNEDELNYMYPNLEAMDTGSPFGWWIKSGTTAGVKELRFVPTPDAAYPIVFTIYEQSAVPAGDSNTVFNRTGDQYLEAILTRALCEQYYDASDIRLQRAISEENKQHHKYITQDYNNRRTPLHRVMPMQI